MTIGIFLLGLAYVLSQFFRAFLAVLTPALGQDIGATPDDLAFASGLWFLTFAACQLPIGWALDSIGPRRTAAGLLLLGGGGGAAVFALATAPLHISIAMALIGVGCAPVLMASYYIFAREYPPAQFAVLASLMVGLGSLGNLVSSYPMAWSSETFGWRTSLWALAGMTALVAMGTWALVKDPAKVEGEAQGSLLELLRLRALWFILPLMGVSYALPGAIRGLWIGPYLSDIFGADTPTIGRATLLMSIAMILGALAYGFADKTFRSRKTMIAGGTAITLAAALILILQPQQNYWLAVAMMCAIGFFASTYPVMMAHGRTFLPPHLIGRGVTLMNLFSIGGVGVFQSISGRMFAQATGGEPTVGQVGPYVAIFTMFTVVLAIGFVVYLFSAQRPETEADDVHNRT